MSRNGPISSPADLAKQHESFRLGQVHAAQTRLLFSNANIGTGVTVTAAAILGRLQWGVVPHINILLWFLYMFLVSTARFVLGLRYRRNSASSEESTRWSAAFAIGAGLAGAGWGAAGVLLYPDSYLANQVFLVFVLGGMMLGAGTLLAPRTEAFVAFILPTGLLPSVRLLLQGGETHLAMGFLCGLFTLATLITTGRIHLTIVSSLKLQFENQSLVEDLRDAKNQAEALNQQLEVRVQERTSALRHSTDQLRAEIAQREKMEDEMLRTRKLESLGVLAGGIAHDFNNFLTVIQGNIEMAKMRLDLDEEVQAILDQSATACQRAVFLSSQLLTFAKGGAPVRRLVSMSKVLLDAVHLARAGAQISFGVTIAEDLRLAEVDPGQIGQVLHNILLNARQAMPEGGIIEVHAENVVIGDPEPGSDGIRIWIRDYGAGIPTDVLPRIFDPYFTTKHGGKGLGLATAYAIIAKHGGHITVESQAGTGTVFTIDLPASKESVVPEAPTAVHEQTGTGRLLVMDDEEALRKLLATVLTKLGYEVQTARDGAEAIALYERAKTLGRGFDAVLLDLTVNGGMGGIDAATRLKEIDPSSKLIVSSGYSDDMVMSDFRRYGFDDVIPKPWSAAYLGQVFRKVLAENLDRRTR